MSFLFPFFFHLSEHIQISVPNGSLFPVRSVVHNFWLELYGCCLGRTQDLAYYLTREIIYTTQTMVPWASKSSHSLIHVPFPLLLELATTQREWGSYIVQKKSDVFPSLVSLGEYSRMPRSSTENASMCLHFMPFCRQKEKRWEKSPALALPLFKLHRAVEMKWIYVDAFRAISKYGLLSQ